MAHNGKEEDESDPNLPKLVAKRRLLVVAATGLTDVRRDGVLVSAASNCSCEMHGETLDAVDVRLPCVMH